MGVACFIYDFDHAKSLAGVSALRAAGITVGCLLAAPWRQLGAGRASSAPAWSDGARSVFEAAGPLYRIDHSDLQVPEIVRRHSCDMGVVLGARILPIPIVKAFPLGIVNCHPGLAPWNRGLDCYKWAVMLACAQGVTCHLIGERIDYGPVLLRRALPSIAGESLEGVKSHLTGLSLEILAESIGRGMAGKTRPMEEPGPYHSVMDSGMELELDSKFEAYRNSYTGIYECYSGYDW